MATQPETRSGIFLNGVQGKLLWSGEKELIVKPKAYDKYNAVPIYWFDERFVYGLLVLGNPQGPIGRDDAMKLAERTRISPEEFNQFWPKDTEFWVWKPNIYKKFKNPLEHPNWGESSTFKRRVVLDREYGFPYVVFAEEEEETGVEENKDEMIELCPFSQEMECPKIIEDFELEEKKRTEEKKKSIYDNILKRLEI